MLISELPGATNGPTPLVPYHFPTLWQAFIWRNWHFFKAEKLAEILACDSSTILREATRMGLNIATHHVSPFWPTKGYQTIIRENWHLLPYSQLLQLLDWQPEQLAYFLKEEDFLWVKLGLLKPQCGILHYQPLTQEQEKATDKLRKTVAGLFPSDDALEYQKMPFEFEHYYQTTSDFSDSATPFKLTFIHPFSGSGSDVLLDIENHDPISESLLEAYSNLGIGGIWLHAILYQLHPIPNAEHYSIGWQKRIANLRTLTERCARFGLKLFLYLNEPRGMEEKFYQNHPDWAGVRFPEKMMRANCTSKKTPLLWMEEALHAIFSSVPLLGGAFFITMSENPTHCNSRLTGHLCPLCSQRPAEDLVIEVLTAAERGIHSASPEAKVMAFDWSWRKFAGEEGEAPAFTAEQIVRLLPKKCELLCNSEWGKSIEIGGIQTTVRDYSLSQVGPSQETLDVWHVAKQCGLETAAKIQVNASWELASVPYIPVPYLIQEHLDKLKHCGIQDLMLSWTLGGYPGGNLKLLKYGSVEKLARATFSSNLVSSICEAWKLFSEAFKAFPFELALLYSAPMNSGPANMLFPRPTKYKATMVAGFPYDDLDTWCSVYPQEVVERQFEKITEGWQKGLAILEKIKTAVSSKDQLEYDELVTMSLASYCHLRSALLQIRFVRLRNAGKFAELIPVIKEEQQLALTLLSIVRQDPRIGFEASNHYLYSIQRLAEKAVQCSWLIQEGTAAFAAP